MTKNEYGNTAFIQRKLGIFTVQVTRIIGCVTLEAVMFAEISCFQVTHTIFFWRTFDDHLTTYLNIWPILILLLKIIWIKLGLIAYHISFPYRMDKFEKFFRQISYTGMSQIKRTWRYLQKELILDILICILNVSHRD